MTFDMIQLFLVHMIVEHEPNRSQLFLTALSLLPCARHLRICDRFCTELFDVSSCVGSGH